VTNQKMPKKIGQMLQNGQMRFFMASAVKNCQIFRNWPWNGHWPSWQPCYMHCER